MSDGVRFPLLHYSLLPCSTSRGLRFSSMATKVNVPSVTLCSASSVGLRRQASTRIVKDVRPIRKMAP